FGEQRFGRNVQNVQKAVEWLLQGGTRPRSRFDRKFLVSVLQSAWFNEALASRICDGLFARHIEGDLLRKEDTGGLFVANDPAEGMRRMEAWAVSPTGPMFGSAMRTPEAEAWQREQQVLARWCVTQEHLVRWGRHARGTRRVLRV